jgi:hypothetical protein
MTSPKRLLLQPQLFFNLQLRATTSKMSNANSSCPTTHD